MSSRGMMVEEYDSAEDIPSSNPDRKRKPNENETRNVDKKGNKSNNDEGHYDGDGEEER